MNTQGKLGSRIREARIECGLSQTELAQEIGVSSVSVSQWENYAKMPSRDSVVRLADALDVTTDWILGRE